VRDALTPKGGRRVYTARWADRHGKKQKRVATPWPDDQDAFLKAACLTAKSFGEIRDAFNRQFPESCKSRSAIIGRAQRQGYADFKPQSSPYKARKRKARKATVPKIKIPRIKGDKQVKVKEVLAPVVFKESLRDDAEPIVRRSGPHTVKRRTPEQIAQARKGHLPCIIEEQPLTSVGIGDTERDSCKWPTSDDIRSLEVCGAPAEIGAYCKRHAMVAYREMPTKRRNQQYSRRGMIEDEQRIKDRDARMIADSVLDDEVESPGMSDEVTGLLEHFVKDVAK
jgi:hypothetical protein